MTYTPEEFTEWLENTMPAGTVIGNPRWWAERILGVLNLTNQAAEIERLKAELAECKEDAERYRWLRKGASDEVAVVCGLGAMDYGMSAVAYTYSEEIDGDDLDATIDQDIASMSTGEQR